ncbi:MAG: hypothetical protein Q9208_003465 [Pyrenodesmia sp. 3 TL-2023]
MTTGAIGLDLAEVSKADAPQLQDVPAAPGAINEKRERHLSTPGDDSSGTSGRKESVDADDGKEYPTAEEVETLRRVCGTVPWAAYTIAVVELCERFSYYGTTAVSYIADQYWGRYKTIQVSIAIALVGHVILIIATIPQVIAHPNRAIGCFCLGLIIFGVGVGGFKPNISPLIAEQYESAHPKQYIKVQKSGERNIVDPTMTVSRIYMYFYLMINVGALAGQIGMVYAEKYQGFWLSFVLPTIMFLFCPLIMFLMRNKYARRPPTGSVLAKALKLWGLAMKGRWSINPAETVKNLRADDFWENVKPSHLGANKPDWMTFDDIWVDEVRRGLKACTVFLWYPLWWLSYNQMTTNMVSQAATMELNGAPNDLINNINPIALVIFIPITDRFLYPGLERMGIRFTPLKRIAWGFGIGSASMVAAAVIQYYIYRLGSCGDYPSERLTEEEPTCVAAPINVWVQTIPYLLIAFSEIFASITGLEYAFTKAPKNMRSVVTAIFLFMSAISYAIGQAFVSLSTDPLLIWNYTVIAILAFLGGCGFWLTHRGLDKQEDKLNFIPESSFKGRRVDHNNMNA